MVNARLRKKCMEWLKRYGPLEIAATLAAYGASRVTYELTGSEVYAAIAATHAGNIAYYGPLLIREIIVDRRAALIEGEPYGAKGLLKTTRNLAWEFGPAATIDTLVTRPFLTGLATVKLGREFGVPAGKYSADAIFYLQTIFSYEMLKRKGMRNT
jgi:hypothetical protein